MLGDHPIYVVLLATDLATAKDFYHRQLGLELLDESPYALNFRCGTTQLTLSKSTTGTSDEQTQAAWMVDDLDAELIDLRSRGVEIQSLLARVDKLGVSVSKTQCSTISRTVCA